MLRNHILYNFVPALPLEYVELADEAMRIVEDGGPIATEMGLEMLDESVLDQEIELPADLHVLPRQGLVERDGYRAVRAGWLMDSLRLWDSITYAELAD
jgi:hypothetical protein